MMLDRAASPSWVQEMGEGREGSVEAHKRQSKQNGMQIVVIVILMASALTGIDTMVI